MGNTTEKLVLLALATENVDEAISALKRARKIQPKGKLQFSLDVSQADLVRERMEFVTEREEFETERRDYQRRILAGEKERANRTMMQGIGEYANVLAKPVATAVLTLAILGGAGYGAMAYVGADAATAALAERICDTVGPTLFIDCSV